MTDNSVKTEYSVALGFFDGLHRAHFSVLESALINARRTGLTPAVLLFDEHPRTALTGEAVPALLTREERDERLIKMGFTLLFVSFKEIMNMLPAEFVSKILCEKYPAGSLSCGYNYNFGKNAAGNTGILGELCKERGIALSVCPEFTLDGQTVSSTEIRRALENGDVEAANKMLGYPFGFTARVFTGDRRGRLLGAPTINQYIPGELITPKFGVYASRVYFDGREFVGVTNIGARPTFGEGSVRSETYIVDFSGDLYGRDVRVEIYSFVRGEKKFPDADTLKAQIEADVESAKRYFSEGQ